MILHNVSHVYKRPIQREAALNRVSKALKEIAKNTGEENAPDAFRSMGEINKVFLEHPENFVKVAKIVGGYAGDVFRSLSGIHMAKFFVDKPDKFFSNLKMILDRTGENAPKAFKALSDMFIGDLFIKDIKKYTSYFEEKW